jgi:LYR motif-containing protein 2-like
MQILELPVKRVEVMEVLHLYRRLLRAITYLPDSNARTYIHNEVVDRFRGNAKNSKLELIPNRVRKARGAAICCERAGKGSLDDLKKVLFHTHGRAGARRRMLIQNLLRPDESVLPKDDAALKQLIETPNLEHSDTTEKLSPRMAALIESQKRNHPAESPKPKIRQLQVQKTTMWGRQPPRKLEKSRWRKWWASTLDRLLPPVPQHEWDRLRDLALRKLPLDEYPKRRSRPTVEEEEGEKEEDMAYRYLQLRLRSESGQLDGATFDPKQGLKVETKTQEELLEESYVLPPARSRRRLYALIWSMTPIMSQDEVTKRWNVEWGMGKSSVGAGLFSQPSAGFMELFEGFEQLPQDPQQARFNPEQLAQLAKEREEKRANRQAKWQKRQEMAVTT